MQRTGLHWWAGEHRRVSCPGGCAVGRVAGAQLLADRAPCGGGCVRSGCWGFSAANPGPTAPQPVAQGPLRCPDRLARAARRSSGAGPDGFAPRDAEWGGERGACAGSQPMAAGHSDGARHHLLPGGCGGGEPPLWLPSHPTSLQWSCWVDVDRRWIRVLTLRRRHPARPYSRFIHRTQGHR